MVDGLIQYEEMEQNSPEQKNIDANLKPMQASEIIKSMFGAEAQDA